MGLFDRLTGLFGDDEPDRDPDPEDLFDLSTVALTMADDLGFEPTGDAALCFSTPESEGFEVTLEDLAAVLEATEADTGATADFHEDDHGFRWVVLHDDSVETLVTNLQFAAETFVDRRYHEHLLAALLGFERDGRLAYLVYSFDRGTFYPFAPTDVRERERDMPTEFRLRSVLADELPVEPDESKWFPLWSDTPGGHPWE